MTAHDPSRRSFLKKASALTGAVILPRHVLGGRGHIAPSDQLTLACVGVGSQGLRVMMQLLEYDQVRVVAVCDVNSGSGDFVEWGDGELKRKSRQLVGDDSFGPSEGAWAGREVAKSIVDRFYAVRRDLPRYACAAHVDYRTMLEREPGLDAVVVGTPDHLHAAVSVAAMRHGKHVFCQKPMAHSVEEARIMAAVATETAMGTQVATGNSASEATRLLSEWIAAGAVGPVREVHNWSTRPFWPQGIAVPTEQQSVPPYLNWDLWLGPARERRYHSAYQPFVWRGWYDFGTGSIGDMGCYSFDTIFRALNLRAPSRVEASSTEVFPDSFPLGNLIHFHFDARGDMPPVTVHWYDGRLRPAIPEELGAADLPDEGLLFVGDRGKILCGFNGRDPKLIPDSAMNAFEPPPQTLPRSVGHYEEWFDACRGGPEAGASFQTARWPTEAILLGNVAVRSGKRIHWDPDARTTGSSEADVLLNNECREGWEL